MRFHTGVVRVIGLGCALACVLALAGCGASRTGTPSAMRTMPDGTVMSGAQMSAMPGMKNSSASPTGGSTVTSAGSPSAPATMVCSDEIAGAVHRNLAVTSTPPRHATWHDQTYVCNYVLAGGQLTLSVKDLTSPVAGRAYFDHLRGRLPNPSAIKGIADLGFPAFETSRGDVVFLKDGKTLRVDATQVPMNLLPPGFSRTAVAYGVAAAVIACWKG